MIFFLARNAQLVGHERRFAERFVTLLNSFCAIEILTDNYAILQNNKNNLDFIDSTSSTFQNFSLISEKIAHLMEILFFVTKNSKLYI